MKTVLEVHKTDDQFQVIGTNAAFRGQNTNDGQFSSELKQFLKVK